MKTVNTGAHRLSLTMLTVLGYLATPLIFGMWLQQSLRHGDYAVGADSIAIPFTAFVIIWLIGWPVVVKLCYAIELVGKRYEISRYDRNK